ncbi:MAG: hypothetical protein COU30_03595 [Candidatus Magasanikbacteria bacterium CG10_big_fil_rev_8_21_14_0_10_38_6]|uniref:CopY family transcriptional regulator n=1 Tax=Candidatus Magasanikbacteria bacterium CG10_big_fil_rev_8_21_14_0_10_38_6 TaxID=1974647 RepID=A0A2M6P0J8_9BACT|nr:MAG: hypothetical protein COU30_03595 [Candidatus Magasanikbacteria bacterium CG10_big_fil_rev_8_21_14_0_10_38_6]
MVSFSPHSVSTDAKGIEKVLGELESHILRAVWKLKMAKVRDVKDEVEKTYKSISFNAVMTVMNRMLAKGILIKEKKDGVFMYTALMAEFDFKKGIIRSMLSALISDRSLFSAAYFADLKENMDEKSLEKLRKFLQ